MSFSFIRGIFLEFVKSQLTEHLHPWMDIPVDILECNQYSESLLYLASLCSVLSSAPEDENMQLTGQIQPIKGSFQLCISCQTLKVRRNQEISECLTSLENKQKIQQL